MPINTDQFSPTLWPVVLDADLGKATFRGLIICEDDCTVNVTCVGGSNVTVPIPSGADVPFVLEAQIAKVNTSGTSASTANLIGLR